MRPAVFGLAVLALAGLLGEATALAAPAPGPILRRPAVAPAPLPVARAQAPAPRPADDLPAIGLSADAGIPDGFIGSLVVRPVPALRLQVGGGSNTASAGVRGGVTLLPFGVGPSLSGEVGHALDGRANSVVRTFFGGMGKF